MYNDLQLWNLNCYLSKNRTFHHVEKKTLDIRNTFFFEGVGKEKLYIFEFTSPTKISLLYNFENKENVSYFWKKVFPFMCDNLKPEKILVGRNLLQTMHSSRVITVSVHEQKPTFLIPTDNGLPT